MFVRSTEQVVDAPDKTYKFKTLLFRQLLSFPFPGSMRVSPVSKIASSRNLKQISQSGHNKYRPFKPQWRRGWDSNPRYGVAVYSLSRGAPSAARPPLPLRLRDASRRTFRLHFTTSANAGKIARFDAPRCGFYPASSALAPETISMISVVIADCRARLYFSFRLRRKSSALEVALSMATMRAPCSAAFDSSSTRHTW